MKVGLLGHGVVGSGVAEILTQNKDVVEHNACNEIVLQRIVCLNAVDAPYADLVCGDAGRITAGEDIDIVVECMGGVEPAFSFLRDALQNGKHCVTSNKELVVEKGAELLALARKNGVQFLYEASCGGGIPVLHPMKFCLGANRLERVLGILNGTTNYILTQMRDNGSSYAEALLEAQALGYAEKDPTADVEGHDARRKTAILSNLAFGSELLDDRQYPCEGISGIDYADMLFADQLGCAVKLLGISEKTTNGYTAGVQPCLLEKAHPLANVNGVFNAIMVQGDMVGDVLFYGPGAGKLPTASAVVSDIIEIADGMTRLPLPPAQPIAFDPADDRSVRYFVRIAGGDTARAAIEDALPGCEFLALPDGRAALLTPEQPRAGLGKALDALAQSGHCIGQRIRLIK